MTTKTELRALAKAHDNKNGIKSFGKSTYQGEWSIVEKWNPEIRYKPIGSHARQTAQDMLTSTETLVNAFK
jgi:hypothetical protein